MKETLEWQVGGGGSHDADNLASLPYAQAWGRWHASA